MNRWFPDRKWLRVYSASPLGAKLIAWAIILLGGVWGVKALVVTLKPVETPSDQATHAVATNQGSGTAVAIGNTSAPVLVINKQGSERQTVEDLLEAQRLSNAMGLTNPVDQLSRQALHPPKDDRRP